MLEGMETAALLNWEASAYFSSAGRDAEIP